MTPYPMLEKYFHNFFINIFMHSSHHVRSVLDASNQ
uniref:Uncharacterized protein n=1 Tax=Arundo donax TaxID=35708 RepID=A0A0A9E048_ARUDO